MDKGQVAPCGYWCLVLSKDGDVQAFRFGTLVAVAWLGTKPAGQWIRHLDGDLLNDRVENLAYGTEVEFRADQALRARREEAAGAPTHCPSGHRYSDHWMDMFGERNCAGCRHDHYLSIRDRKLAHQARYRAEHADEIRAKKREDYQKHRTERLAGMARYRAARKALAV